MGQTLKFTIHPMAHPIQQKNGRFNPLAEFLVNGLTC